MVGEVAATLKGQLSGVGLGVVYGRLPKTFRGFPKHVLLCLASLLFERAVLLLLLSSTELRR